MEGGQQIREAHCLKVRRRGGVLERKVFEGEKLSDKVREGREESFFDGET